MSEPRLCPYCGIDISHKNGGAKHCGSVKCKGKHRRMMHGKEINLKCVICGKPLSKGQAKYCSKNCSNRNKSIQAAKLYATAIKKDRVCIFCQEPIPRDLKNWWQRKSCGKTECEKKRIERQKIQKKKSVKRHNEKINELSVAGVKEQYIVMAGVKHKFNKNDPEYFDHEMYLTKQKELKKPNGRFCQFDGCKKALRGEEWFFCKVHRHAVSAIADNGFYENDYAYM